MPSEATRAQCDTMLQNTTAVFRSIYNFANSSSPNFRDKESTLFNSLKGEFGGSVYAPVQAIHGDFGAMLRRARASIAGIARAYAKAFGFAGTTLAQLWPQIYRKFEDESWSVDSRELTFGTIAARAQATGSLQTVAKASYTASTDYITLTAPDGTTYAFWFDTTGGDSEPAGSSGADNSYQVDISGDTSAADVAATLEGVIDSNSIGVDADDSAGSGQVDLTVDEYGFEGNDWAIAETVGDAGFTVTAFSGGQDGTDVSGDGTIHRLTKDSYANVIEASTAEIKHFECKADAGSGTEAGEELFEVRGREAEVFATLQEGSGVVGRIKAKSARNSLRFIENPSFDSDATSSSPTSITGWTVNSAIGNYEIVTTNFRSMPGVSSSNSRGLKQTAADKVTQTFKVSLDPSRPFECVVAVKGFSSANGNAIIRCGSNSKTVAVTSSWQQIKLDLDENLWYDNFREATLDIELEWTGTTGYVVWDDLVCDYFDLVDGTWYFAVGGQTAWSRKEILSCEDTEGNSTALIQWFLRQAGLYLPGNNAGGETLTDPSL